MKGLLWLLAAIAIAAGLSVAMRENEGYVLFVASPWRIELSLNLFVILLAAAFGAAYLLMRVVAHTLRLPGYVRAFRVRQGERRGRSALAQSLQVLYEGRVGHAEKLASRAYELGTFRSLAALVAARAAQRLRNFALRDGWLARARESEPEWRQATLATEAELLIEERNYDRARAVLQELHASGARHIATLTALLRAERGLENWPEVVRLAKLLDKRDAMPREALIGIVVNARVAMLSRAGLEARELDEIWKNVPTSEQRHPRIAAAAARAWIRLGECHAAQTALESALGVVWDAELVLLYGECCGGNAMERIERAERWLMDRPQDVELLLALGRLCVQRELWGKARSYFEASLTLQSRRDTHVALAQLCERIGLADEAARHYRSAALAPA